MDWSDMGAIRQTGKDRFALALEALGATSPHCTESDLEIPRRDGGRIGARLCKPTAPAPGGSPLAVLFFGGGFVMGFPEQMTIYARTLAASYGATVVLADYRVAPEDPWPAAPHDAWDTVAWAGKHDSELGADASKGFIIGGISAGANLSLVVGSQYVEEGHSPPLTGLWLSVPMVFALKEHVPEQHRNMYLSMKQNAHTAILDVDNMAKMRELYVPDISSLLYSPGLRTEAVAKMPPVYFQVCGMDPLRDDSLIYKAILEAAGRKTLMHIYPGMVHAGWAFFPSIKLAKQSHIDFRVGMGWLLGREPREDPSDAPEEGGMGA